MPSVSVSGLSSGLDTQLLLEKLRQNEQTRLQPYVNAENSHKAKKAAWEGITTALQTLNKSVKTLQDEAFNGLSLSECKHFRATTTSGATADTYNIRVNQLATVHKLVSSPVGEKDDLLGSDDASRTLIIRQKSAEPVRITLNKDETSLPRLAQAINQQAGNVKASIRLSDEGYRLFISSGVSGTGGEITLQVEGDPRLEKQLSSIATEPGSEAGMTTMVEAKDARLEIDRLAYTRGSNHINDILPGINLELQTISDEYESLTLTPNPAAINKDIQDFVKSYNACVKQTLSASKYQPPEKSSAADRVQLTSDKNGPLVGDPALRELIREMNYAAKDIYGNAGSRCRSLADVGITLDALTGQMTLDQRKLDTALEASPDDVKRIFTHKNAPSGVAERLDTLITRFTGGEGSKNRGTIAEVTKSLHDQTEKIKKQRDRAESIIDAQMKEYATKFQQLEVLLSQLNQANAQLAGLVRPN